jgi:CIC family chloride channel protein
LLSADQLPVHARRLRAILVRSIPFLEARGLFMVVLAGAVGASAGLLVTAMSAIVQGLHALMFDVQPGGRRPACSRCNAPSRLSCRRSVGCCWA